MYEFIVFESKTFPRNEWQDRGIFKSAGEQAVEYLNQHQPQIIHIYGDEKRYCLIVKKP